jgi:hypothetical protein
MLMLMIFRWRAFNQRIMGTIMIRSRMGGLQLDHLR